VYALEYECGTFLEIHRPFDEEIIETVDLEINTPLEF